MKMNAWATKQGKISFCRVFEQKWLKLRFSEFTMKRCKLLKGYQIYFIIKIIK